MRNNKNDKKNLFVSIIMFSIGILFSNFIFIEYSFLFFLIFSVILFLIILWNKKNNLEKTIKYFVFLLFFIVGFFVNQYYCQNKVGHFDFALNKKISTNIIVSDEVIQKDFYTKIIGKIEGSTDQVTLKASKFPVYEYGDKLKVEGYLLEIQNFKNDLGKEFDYKNFLKKDGIYYEIKNPKIKYISSGNGNYIKEKLFLIKKTFLEKAKKIIPDPESSLLGGLLLGAKENMDKQTLDDFRRTGVIHIVVLSGYNLTIVAEFIMIMLAFLGFEISAWIGGISIVLFAIMTGASATIIRAAFMALIVIFAKLSGRESEALKALFIAGFVMLLVNPMLLLYDPSFQLSFLATLGLLLLSPWIEKFLEDKMYFKKNIFELRTLVSATVATSIFVAPLLLYMMGEISIISPIVNLLILIFVPFTMLFGFIAILISFLSFKISMLVGFISYIFLYYDIFITNFFSKLSFATVRFNNFSLLVMILIYIIYLIIFLTKENKK